LCRQLRISNCWPYKGWKGWVTVKSPSARDGDGVVDGLVQCVRGEVAPHLWAGVLTSASSKHTPRGTRGNGGLSLPLQRRAASSGASLWQCPSSCGLSGFAHVTSARHPRVDPDAWLATLDQKMYLRHVGRDGCVDVDLATYYIGPQMAGCTVLLQVEAQSRQFAVWHQDQVVKLLPIKGLLGQEMALDDYLQYILQEALAAPRRSSARRGRQSPPAASLGGGSLISSFIRQLSQALALSGARAGKLLSPGFAKT